MPPDLEKMTVKELRKEAKALGIKRIGLMKKATLIKRIGEHAVGVAAEPIAEADPVVSTTKGLKKFACLTGVIANGNYAPVKMEVDGEMVDFNSEIIPPGSTILLNPDKPYVKRWIKLGAIKRG